MIMTSYQPSFDASLYLKDLYGWTSIKIPNNATVGYFDPIIIYFPTIFPQNLTGKLVDMGELFPRRKK